MSPARLISIVTMPDLPSPEQQRQMLRSMLTIRHFEERAAADYHADARDSYARILGQTDEELDPQGTAGCRCS